MILHGCIKTVSPRAKCTIKLELKNLSLESTEQDLTSLFVVRGVNVSFVGTLQPAPVAPIEPIASVSITPSDINFGTINVGSFVEKTVIVKNNGTASTTLNISAPSSLAITVSSTCGVSLAARSSCSLKYKYSSTIAEQVVSQNLSSVANNPITYSVSSLAPSAEEPEVLSIIPQTNSIEYSLTQPSVQSGTIRFTNTGTIALTAPVSAVSSNYNSSKRKTLALAMGMNFEKNNKQLLIIPPFI